MCSKCMESHVKVLDRVPNALGNSWMPAIQTMRPIFRSLSFSTTIIDLMQMLHCRAMPQVTKKSVTETGNETIAEAFVISIRFVLNVKNGKCRSNQNNHSERGDVMVVWTTTTALFYMFSPEAKFRSFVTLRFMKIIIVITIAVPLAIVTSEWII